jgi:hypothetical protein
MSFVLFLDPRNKYGGQLSPIRVKQILSRLCFTHVWSLAIPILIVFSNSERLK